jgi:hypothetical protein
MKAEALPVDNMPSRTYVLAVDLSLVCSNTTAEHEVALTKTLGSHYLKARSFNSTLSTSHHSNLTGVDASTDPNILFASEATCILGPDVTQGPYCKLSYL